MESIKLRKMREKYSAAEKILLSVLAAIPVFFLFVLIDARAGYDVFDFHPTDLFPPIPIYLADFSLCFSSRLLIGSITRLFSYQLTLPQLYTICGVMNMLALICVSLIGGTLIRKGIEKKSFFVLFVLCMTILNPVVAQQNYPAIGSYDTYWIVLFSVLILLCKTRCFAIFSPFLCFTGMMVHYGFMFSFLPAVAALLLYDAVNAEGKGRRLLSGCSLGVTGISSAFVLFYSFFFSKANITMTGEEFHEYLLSRFKLMGVEEIRLKKMFGDNLFPFNFFEVYFFDKENGLQEILPTTSGKYLETFYNYLKNSVSVEFYLKYAAALLPFIILFSVFWITCAKRNKDIKKLPFIAFAGVQYVFFAACFFSNDLYRWGASMLISQITLLLIMLVKKDKTVAEILDSPVLRSKKIMICALCAGAALVLYFFIFGAHLPRTMDR